VEHKTYELQKDSSGNWILNGSMIRPGSQVIEVKEYPGGATYYNLAVVDSELDGTLILTYAHMPDVSGPRLKVGMKLEWDPAYNG
jgi:hypothetical protein